MKNSTFRLFFFCLLTASTAIGADYFTLYKERIAGAQNYEEVDPIVNSAGELTGFVFSDAANKKLIIQTPEIHREIPLSGTPLMTVNKWIREDSLVVYCLFNFSSIDRIGIAEVVPGTFGWYDTIPPLPFDGSAGNQTNLQQIRLVTDLKAPFRGLLYETRIINQWYDATQGPSEEWKTRTIVFDESLQHVLLNERYYGITFGTLTSLDTVGYAGFENYFYSWNWSDLDNPNNFGSYENTANVVKRLPSESPLASWGSNSCHSLGIFFGDFLTDYQNDEIICISCPQAAGVTATGHGYVATCYSFASGQREILWYNYEDRWDKLDYWYKDGRVLAGSRGANVAVFLNARTGIPGDSAVFTHDISSFRYFETGTSPKQLNLAGRVYDTIIVYQFNAITETEEPKEATLPAHFSLSQNYPNPFNPTTTIEFEIPRRSIVKLAIYNTLGQQIRTLVNESLSAGTYSRIWDGKTDAGKAVSSGMYFYQVSGDTFSQSKKMILLK